MSSLIRPRSVGGATLVRDYLHEIPSASPFYSGAPHRLESIREKLKEVSRRFGPDDRRRAASALRPSSAAARDRLQRFVAQGGAVVTTGQQAGFLTGPLYTIYKAVSAAVLATHLEERLGVVVLPVFWVASEDHDWDEVNHARLLDSKGRVRRFTIVDEDARSLPMSERRLPQSIETVCDEVAQVVVAKGIHADLVRQILDPYRVPGRTVGAAFGEAIGRLLAGFDLLIADAADPALKEASLPVLRVALEEAEEHESVLEARTEALVAAGYQNQVTVLSRGTNVFVHGEGGRERLYRAPGGFVLRDRTGILPRDEVLARLASEPKAFSPNVLLRPVVESTVFPTLAYVGGPGEIGYFAQAGALFEAYGIVAPVVVPRFSGTVVEGAVERLMRKLELGEEDLLERRDALRDRLARREVPPELTIVLEQLRAELVQGYEDVLERAGEMDPTLFGALGALRNRSLADTRRAERKIVRSIKRRDLIMFEQLDRVLDTLRPDGLPQDRVLNVLPFVARYGEHFLKEVQRTVEAEWRLPE